MTQNSNLEELYTNLEEYKRKCEFKNSCKIAQVLMDLFSFENHCQFPLKALQKEQYEN